MNFERGLDPKKSMDIGVKVYRCGNCGSFTNEDGSPISEDDWWKVTAIMDKVGDSKTELVHGDCCAREFLKFTQMRVTHDMALDAGDPDLEGTFY